MCVCVCACVHVHVCVSVFERWCERGDLKRHSYIHVCTCTSQKAAMSKRSAELIEEELGEAQAIAEEAKAREAKWKSAK